MTREAEIENDEFAGALRQLKPAASEIDISSVFFDAGYRTAMAERSAANTKHWMQLVCAAVLGGLIVAAASYRLASLAGTPTAKSIKAPAATVGDSAVPVREEIAAAGDQLPIVDEPVFHPESEIGFFATVATRWLVRGRDDSRDLATTLTAAHSSALQQSDFNRRLADIRIGLDNRYHTFAQDQSMLAPEDAKPLAVRDGTAMANGDY